MKTTLLWLRAWWRLKSLIAYIWNSCPAINFGFHMVSLMVFSVTILLFFFLNRHWMLLTNWRKVHQGEKTGIHRARKGLSILTYQLGAGCGAKEDQPLSKPLMSPCFLWPGLPHVLHCYTPFSNGSLSTAKWSQHGKGPLNNGSHLPIERARIHFLDNSNGIWLNNYLLEV